MSFLGKTIHLRGLTQKGKNRVREHGEHWCVLAETDRVLFKQDVGGPWLFITPVGHGQDDKASRWIRVNGDEDFTITTVNG